MNPTFQVINTIGNILTLNNLIQVLQSTYLSQNQSPGSTTLNVDNTTPFTAAGILLIAGIGNANSEMVPYTAKPSTTTFTSSATLLTHIRGESVDSILYNQFVIESSPTINGSYTVVATISIDPTKTYTRYVHAAGTAGAYYRVKFRNSVTTDSSGYSPSIAAALPDYNSAQGMINQIMVENSINPNDPVITQEFLLTALNTSRTTFDNLTYGYQWDWRQRFNYPIKVLAGTNFIDLPDFIDFRYTNGSLVSSKMNGYNYGYPYPLNYIDKKLWNTLAMLQQGSVLAADVSIGATSITLENSGDFPTSGTLFIATEQYNQTILTIQYTGNDLQTNVLSGISGSAITRNISAGTQVWVRNIGTLIPYNYTVFDEKMVFDNAFSDQLQGRNIYIDVYERLTPITNSSDILKEHHSHIYKSYIKYLIKKERDDSIDPKSDPDYLEFMAFTKAINDNLYTGQYMRIKSS